MRHDRGLEGPPEHAEDCNCRQCRADREEDRNKADFDEMEEEG